MNTALERAQGEYIYFLNAGDELFDAQATSEMRTMGQQSPVWFYGQVCFVDDKGRETTPPPFDYAKEKAASFSNGRFPPHQGTVARRTALKELGGFDTSFAIAADYALFLRLSTIAQPLETSATLARFFTGGLSSTAWKASLAEFHRARREILPMTPQQRAAEGLRTQRTRLVMSLARLKP
jgi:GT2 family glycosyltransferase